MANKSQFVDLIGDATQQKRRRREEKQVATKSIFDTLDEQAEPERRLSNWPPARFAKWRMETVTPWKMKVKAWTYKDWT